LDAPERSDEFAHSVRWRVIEYGEKKRFWDESTQGFAPGTASALIREN
jgi:hypothetical protein